MDKLNYDPVYLEILRMAKELAIQEYKDVRAQDHNKWLVESEHLWRTQRLRLAYPTIPTPPTEKDVIARAQILLNFLKKEETKKDIVDQSLTLNEIIELEEKEQAMTVEDAKPIIANEPTIEDAKEIPPKSLAEAPPEEKSTQIGGRILPSVIKKIEELKNNWSKN